MLLQQSNLDNADLTLGAEMGDLADDRSSSLSEPEDDNDLVEELDTLAEDAGEGVQVATQLLLDDDSEAETERLEQTPQKLNRHPDELGRTPSKLSQAATMDDELSEPPSPLPLGTGGASSTSTLAMMEAGKKRKRTDSDESPLTSPEPDLVESPRERTHELLSGMQRDDDEEHDDATGTKITAEVVRGEERGVLGNTSTPATLKVKKGKPRGRKPKEPVEFEAERPQEMAGLDSVQTEESTAKTEEDRQSRATTSAYLQGVAKQFRFMREALYNDRIAQATAELRMLEQPDCQHREYVAQVACVDARREKQMREAQAFYHYRLTSIRQRTIGERAQLHSQYFQSIRDKREEHLYKLGEHWYNIQKERREQHQEQDEKYIYKFPAKKSVQIRQQAKYNQEISVLSGVAKYVGFPAAPEMKGAEGNALDDDLKAMKISKRVPVTDHAASLPQVHQQPPQPQQPFYQRLPTVPTQNERLAHEQFIEQNAWAQPQRPIHLNHGTSTPSGANGPTHTPDWQADQHAGTHRDLIRNLNGTHLPMQQRNSRTGSPFATPLPQRKGGFAPLSEGHVSSGGTIPIGGSDGVEIPSSVAAAPPTADRMGLHQRSVQASPMPSPLMVQKQRYGMGGAKGAGDERERTVPAHGNGIDAPSGTRIVSGASTIDAPTADYSPELLRHPQREHSHEWRESPRASGVMNLPMFRPAQHYPRVERHDHRRHDDQHHLPLPSGPDGAGAHEAAMRSAVPPRIFGPPVPPGFAAAVRGHRPNSSTAAQS
ncbi:hypothetical protein LTR62_004997 [Meristemomyces frigidus]|uniref:Uncharacterized protein n=1 Tax=Meristemomyces frigidus TaxID=1508187 RepID=A0AAN7TI39_9PEZI|nr:hypothetical protein LTR62_004997 [Meristemomyces frigidus]